MRLAARRSAQAIGLLSPTLLGVALFFVAPVLFLGWMAMQHWDLLGPPAFTGIAGLLRVVGDPRLLQSVGVTAEVGAVALAIELLAGLALAKLIVARAPGRRALTVALLCPWMIAPLVVGVIARWILAPSDGVIAHLVGHRIDVLSDAWSAPLAVAGAMVWQDTGFAAIVLAAALSSVPRDLVAAAALDGAGPCRVLRSVELPLLVPTILFLGVTGTVRAASLYDLAVPLTGGGPAGATTTVTGFAVSTAWDRFDFGDAAVISLLTGAAVLIVVASLSLLARRMPS